MPWRVETSMSERRDFVEELGRGHWGMTALCLRFGISRKTGYQWWQRSVTAAARKRARRSARAVTVTPREQS